MVTIGTSIFHRFFYLINTIYIFVLLQITMDKILITFYIIHNILVQF